MALINIENSTQTYGDVKSIAIRDAAGSTLAYAEPGITAERAAYLALTYSAGLASNLNSSHVAGFIASMFDSQISLYSLQRLLNDGAWEQCRLHVEAEFHILGSPLNTAVLLVATTWGKEEN